jgi:anti-sigma-K factor RskA
MTDAPLTPRDDDLSLAGEYVLGVLDAADRARVEARIKADPAFAAEITAWERHFEGLNDGFAAVPAPDLMPKIEARLFGRAEQRRRESFWSRFVLGAGLATAMLLAAVLVIRDPPLPGGPVLTATLAAEGAGLTFDARFADGTLTVTRTAGEGAPAGQAHELWVIVGEAAPVSLGLLEQATFTRALDALPQGAVLAVSLEPAGGSPTGAPTGPVLVTGAIDI